MLAFGAKSNAAFIFRVTRLISVGYFLYVFFNAFQRILSAAVTQQTMQTKFLIHKFYYISYFKTNK